ncbi:MAG: sigma-70 family RNA polymerase sigma factor, partial [Gemmatimonadetes bacterium]|nr:sigma-70 family RNA polymerase sigma factor [Gemmatimonadota bacterium]
MSESTGPDFDNARALMQRFGPLVETVAERYAEDGDEQDDLYQEIWIRILDRIDQYEGRGALGGWIQRLAHRFARNWWNARKAHEKRLARYEAETLPMDLAESLI